MRAITYTRPGDPSVLELVEKPIPEPGDGEVRIRVLVSGVNPTDWKWRWHGAAPDHFMTHLSITEAPGDERPEADWGEHVTDEEYAAASATDS